jgi:uncharacterized membrane protein
MSIAYSTKRFWKRTFIKAIGWRVLASALTAMIVYFVTGSFVIAETVAAIQIIVNFFAYLVYESLWRER